MVFQADSYLHSSLGMPHSLPVRPGSGGGVGRRGLSYATAPIFEVRLRPSDTR